MTRTDGAPLRERISYFAWQPVDVAPLARFRVALGLLLAVGTIRLLSKGFVASAFARPKFFFPPWPFEAVLRVPSLPVLYTLYAMQVILALALAAGVCVRVTAAALALTFTYCHFLDLTNYLNHYWLVTLLSVLFAFIPADGRWTWRRNRRDALAVPRWQLELFRMQIACVYIFAGLAKLNADWMLRAMPMRVWLAANTDLALVGPLLAAPWVAHAASYFGAFYDLTIPLWLRWQRTKPVALFAVVFFHLVTAALFNIGMFPFYMIGASLLFVGQGDGQRHPPIPRTRTSRLGFKLAALYLALAVTSPLRCFLYGGNPQWHEQGYRFAWRVMLMEKMGSAEFRVVNRATRREALVRLRDYLTPQQEKAMATQPDMILAFAHHLAAEARARGEDVAVFADVWVTLNGRPAARLVDPTTDLARERDGFTPKRWILPAPTP